MSRSVTVACQGRLIINISLSKRMLKALCKMSLTEANQRTSVQTWPHLRRYSSGTVNVPLHFAASQDGEPLGVSTASEITSQLFELEFLSRERSTLGNSEPYLGPVRLK